MTKIWIAAAALIFAGAAHADVMTCSGKGLSFQLVLDAAGKAKGPYSVKADDKTIEKQIRQSAKQEIWGPDTSSVADMPVYYQGEFPSPADGYTGQWELVLNQESGKANLNWDDDDGAFESFDLTCSVAK